MKRYKIGIDYENQLRIDEDEEGEWVHIDRYLQPPLPALEAAKNYRQADADGTFVTVSRQALEELIQFVEDLADV